ncbi:sigma-70 family RNA polymerase sigma factor, partial [Sulfoacidibacillus thermotolerans]
DVAPDQRYEYERAKEESSIKTYTPEQEVAWIRKIIRCEMLNERKRYQRWNREALILNAPIDPNHDEKWIEQVSESSRLSVEEQAELTLLLELLPARERQVLIGLYFDDRSQREVGERLGMSQMMVSKIHRQAIGHMKEMLSDEMHGGNGSSLTT